MKISESDSKIKPIELNLLRNDNFIFRKIDTEKFSGVLKLDSGDRITLPYEQFSKKYQP